MVHFTPTKEFPRRDGGGWLLRRCCRWPQLRAAVCDGRPKHIASASALRRLFELQRRLRRRSPAAMRCAHGRLAQLLRAGRAVDAISVERIVCDGRRMTATAVLQRAMAAAAAARRPHHVLMAPDALHSAIRRHTAVEESCQLQTSKMLACARAAGARCAKWVRRTLYSM